MNSKGEGRISLDWVKIGVFVGIVAVIITGIGVLHEFLSSSSTTAGTSPRVRVPLTTSATRPRKTVTSPSTSTTSTPAPSSTTTTTASTQMVSLLTLCNAPGAIITGSSSCKAGGTIQVGSNVFPYVIQAGADQYPSYQNIAQLAPSTCTSLTLQFVTKESYFSSIARPDLTAMGYVQLTQEHDPEGTQSEPVNAISTMTVPLDGGPLYLNDATTDSSEGNIYEIMYYNGYADCHTASGQ